MKPQLQMLDKMFQAIIRIEQKSQEDSFLMLLEYIATQFEFKDSFATPWMKKETSETLKNLIDLDVLREDKWDWYGELHQMHGLKMILGDYAMSKADVMKRADKVDVPAKDTPAPERILDTWAATGRNILVLSDKYPKAIFYGAELDPVAYKILLLNMKTYDIPSSILNTSQEHDLRAFSPNWRYANHWEPVPKKKYFTEEEIDLRKEITSNGTHNFI